MAKAPTGWELQAPLAYWDWMSAAWDVWSAATAGEEAVATLSQRRFKELVRHARLHSPYYRNLYRALPPEGFESGHVPPATRQALMAHFDEWVTDPQVTRKTVSSFMADPRRAGQSYLGRYAAWTSSGTTGKPGLFVHDERALAVYDALEMLRLGRWPLAPAFPATPLLPGGRYAMVAATGGHFAGVASVERLRLLVPALAGRLQVFSLLEPLPRLVEALNAYQPMFLATYPTAASLLAAERKAGRLTIGPAVIWLGGETLTASCRSEVSGAFRCRILEEYGASECMSIASACHLGRLHLNSDWVMIEPVDRAYRPVPPGETSDTVLLTNLANRVQPIIRYDLGDSVVLESEPCACGSPFPALRVEGRSDEVLCLRNGDGNDVRLLPLALATVVEDFAGAHCFQVVQTAPDALSVRLEAPEAGAVTKLWNTVARALRGYLRTQGLENVTIRRDPAPPQRSARSGKLRRVLAWRADERPPDTARA
jgi:phenylacetate-coenzyme A ligase PaaK-like adenylate-forming protein